MNASFTTEILDDSASLAAIESDWWALWRRIPATTPFQSPAWLRPWWDIFSPGKLHVVAVRRQGKLVGLAPFYLESAGRGRRLMPLGISISDCLDVLLDPDCIEPAAAAMTHRIVRGEWDCWELSELSDDAAAWRLPPPPACRTAEDTVSLRSVLPLPHDAGGLERAIPARKRRKLRMAQNRAARRGGYDVVAADAASLPGLMAGLMRLHALRWAERGEAGVLADPRVAAFHRAAAPRLLEAGLLRLYGLRLAGGLAAVFYGFHCAGRAFAYLSGFDPAAAFISPGTLVLNHAIRQAVREGAREMDFLRGEEAYKRGWGAVPQRNGRRIFQRVAAHALA